MKKHATTILLFVIMFVGLGLLLYPPLSDYYNSFHQTRAIANYAHSVEETEGEDYTAYWDVAHAYNDTLKGRSAVSRLSSAGLTDDGYSDLLVLNGSGIIAVIEIPEIAVTLPVYHGTSDAVLQVAVGHLQGTSLPVGGEGTHCAISAHRGLPSAKLFTNLDQLQLGDLFTLRVLDDVLTYEIDQIRIILPYEVEVLDFVEGMDYCSLITCTPYGVNSHRLVVRGHRVENSTAALVARVTSDAIQIDPMIVTPIVAAPMLVILLIIMLVNTSPKKKRRRAAARRMTNEEIVAQADRTEQRPASDTKESQQETTNQNEEGGERP